jgi:hypothetical protein
VRTSRLWTLAAAAATFLVLPVTASAMTTSQVTSPSADPTYLYDDTTDAIDPPLTVTGTSNGAPGSLADIICTWESGGYHWIVEDVVVGAGGAVTGTSDLTYLPDNTCRLRIVPDVGGTNSTFWHRYQGPAVALQSLQNRWTISGGPNDGKLYNWNGYMMGRNGEMSIYSPSDDAFYDAYAYSPNHFYDDYDAVDAAFELPRVFADGSGDHSSILVDGKNVYTPYVANNLFGGSENLAGFPNTTLDMGLVDGVPTITESFPLVRCTSETEPYNEDAVSCTEFINTGVTMKRTWRMAEDGGSARLHDAFTSTSGAAHRVQLWYNFDHDDSDAQWGINGPDWDTYDEGSRLSGVQLPSNPFTLYGRDNDDYPDGSHGSPTLAITFGTSPHALEWHDEDQFDAAYDVTVPAGGTKDLWFAGSFSHLVKRAVAYGERAEDAFAGPVVTITSPANGSSANGSVEVTGTATDNHGVASLTVNGTEINSGAGGAFSHTVKMVGASTTITVVAKDKAGNTATSAVTVNDAGAPALTVKLGTLPRLAGALQRGIAAPTTCDEACTVNHRLMFTPPKTRTNPNPKPVLVATGRVVLNDAGAKTGRVVFTLRGKQLVNRSLGNRQALGFTLRSVARDSLGNTRTQNRRFMLRR